MTFWTGVARTACALATVAAAANAPAQPAPATLTNVTGCTVEGGDVFVTTGQGPDARRFKYPFDAAVDTLCNAQGFAISAPKTAATAPAVRAAAPAAATATASADFPADLPATPAEALKQKMSGKTYSSKIANGQTWRLEFKPNGYFFINVGTGSTSGPWRTEDGKLCTQPRGEAMTCNEVRERGEVIVLKRISGEVIQLVPQ